MLEDKTEYEKKIDKLILARNRQIARQKEKLASVDYQKKLQAKQKSSQKRAYQKQKARLANPDYIKKQREKKLKSAKKQKARSELIKSTIKSSSKLKKKSIAGRNPTAIEKHLANKIGQIGCICCLNKNWYNTNMQELESEKYISLHHIDGRTKPWAHAKVLPLCAYHHDVPAPSNAPPELTPIHRGNKKQWEEFNGTEEELLKQVYKLIEEEQPWLLEAA